MLLKTLIASLCVIGVALAEQTPVFLWGANSVAKPSLITVSQSEFADLSEQLFTDHMVVAFQENGLTNKDFLCSDSDSAQSCYAQLQGVSPKTFYAGVNNPLEALRAVAAEREFNTVNEDGQLAHPITCSTGKLVIVNFEKGALGEPRESTLAAHDAAIAAITKQLDCNVAYLYMAAPSTSPPVKKRERRATAAEQGGNVFRQGADFLLFFSSLYLKKGTNTTEVTISSMAITNTTTATENRFNVTLSTSDGKSLNFVISKSSDGYFNLNNVVYDGARYYSSGISAPTDFSYFCGNLTLYSVPLPVDEESNDSILIWNSLQFQAPFGSTNNATFVFGDAWHCVGFFTPGILGGLFVTVLLLAILFTGICWMMDINTMDRFDDPKGKTITINAAE